ncbi:MAG: RNA methyltransferase [Polynucleobacter sp.]|nr:RNA methyltransferase [Polynucleobacter sp.]
MTEFISSRENPLFKELRAIQATGSKGQKARLAFGHALLEGIHLLQTWCADPALNVLLTSELGIEHHEINALVQQHLDACPDTRVIYLDANLWSELSELANGPQIAGLVSLPSVAPIGTLNGDVVVLDRIQDAGNVGAILRTAAAAGFTQIVALSGCAHLWSSKVLRAGMGAHRGLKLYEGWSNQQALSAITAPLFLATADGSVSLFDLDAQLKKSVAWVLGSEGQGVSAELLAQGNAVSIPMASRVESLNVATAAAVCLFETVRVRRLP